MALRIRELTEVLDRLGMRKGGRKAELQERVMSVFAAAGSGCAPGVFSFGCGDPPLRIGWPPPPRPPAAAAALACVGGCPRPPSAV